MRNLILVIMLIITGCANNLSSSNEDEFKKINVCSLNKTKVLVNGEYSDNLYKINFPGKSVEQLIKNSWLEICYNNGKCEKSGSIYEYYDEYLLISDSLCDKELYLIYLE